MEDAVGTNLSPCPGKLARKKTPNKQEWKREKKRVQLYSATEPPGVPCCNHKKENAYKCDSLSLLDISKFHSVFYSSKNKIQQDNFILKHTKSLPKERLRPSNFTRDRNLTFFYYIRLRDGSQVRVCQNAFLKILGLKKDRVLGVMKRHHASSGAIATETRGGNRKMKQFSERKEKILVFIQQLKVIESHYNRHRATYRNYLPAELNIALLCKMYNESVEEEFKVKESYFREVVNTNFNFGFGSPKTDACSTCLFFEEQMKTEKDNTKRNEIETLKRVHKLKADAFYSLLKSEDDEALIVTFDCQKNLLLPRVPDQSAYFSRQYSFYNFTLVTGNSKCKLEKENVHCYTWCESDYAKNSNVIASCVYDHLKNCNFEGKTKLKCFADGCGGQNKNTIVTAMLGKWLVTEAPKEIKSIEMTFPMVGHSFLPPDRVFGLIEKDLKKKDTILQPEEYEKILSQHGTVHKVGTSVKVQDWKTEAERVQKKPGDWHFKFNPSKRLILKRARDQGNVLFQGEVNYLSTFGNARRITKANHTMSHIQPSTVKRGTKVKADKIKDVGKLLSKHFGEEWRKNEVLSFYLNLERQNETHTEIGDNEDSNLIVDEELDSADVV